MEGTTINLLPWRDLQRKQKNNIFYLQILCLGFICLGLVFFQVTWLNWQIGQEEQNQYFLKHKMRSLDESLAKLTLLHEEKELILLELEELTDLEAQRGKNIFVLDAVAKTVPEDIFLVELLRQDKILKFTGFAKSNEAVSEFLHRLEQKRFFKNPVLTEIQAESYRKENAQSKSLLAFRIEVSLS